MRLSSAEVQSLVNSLLPFLPPGFSGDLLLFGSQLNDQAKGGDIDLALIVRTPAHLLSTKLIDYKILASMKMDPIIGDRKIDFKILSPEDATLPFFTEALKKAIRLAQIDISTRSPV